MKLLVPKRRGERLRHEPEDHSDDQPCFPSAFATLYFLMLLFHKFLPALPALFYHAAVKSFGCFFLLRLCSANRMPRRGFRVHAGSTG
jgi:hypothetical protein